MMYMYIYIYGFENYGYSQVVFALGLQGLQSHRVHLQRCHDLLPWRRAVGDRAASQRGNTRETHGKLMGNPLKMEFF